MDPASNSHQPQGMGGMPPPPGVVPDFNNPILGYVVASVVICLTTTTLVVWIRTYTVFYIIKSHGWADCTCLLKITLDLDPIEGITLTFVRHIVRCMGNNMFLVGSGDLNHLTTRLQVGFLGFCGADVVGMRWGCGAHQWNVTVPNLIKY